MGAGDDGWTTFESSGQPHRLEQLEPPQAPAPAQPPKSKRGLPTAVWLALLAGAVVATAAITADIASDDDAPVRSSSPALVFDAPTDLPEVTLPPTDPDDDGRTFTPADFRVRLVETGRECFGSAGGLVTVEPELSYVNEAPGNDRTFLVVYEIRGGEDGAQTYSIDVTGGEYAFDDAIISTPTCSTNLTAKVTTVRERS